MNIYPLTILATSAAAIGIWQITAAFRAATPTVLTRLAPLYDPVARLRLGQGGAMKATLRILAGDLGKITALFGSTPLSVRQRLAALGGPMRENQFRIEQLAWAAISLAVALLTALPLLLRAHISPVIIIALLIAAPLLGALSRDSYLTLQVRRYRQKLVAQLPDVCELLSLALAAGEGATQALTRVAAIGEAELPRRLRALLAKVHAGQPLITALQHFGEEAASAPIGRFATAVTTALERGTPLAQVLQALAQDLRGEAREALLEEGGKREIIMLIPVVFIIMPISVIFALYPGLATLSLVVP